MSKNQPVLLKLGGGSLRVRLLHGAIEIRNLLDPRSVRSSGTYAFLDPDVAVEFFEDALAVAKKAQGKADHGR